MALLPEAERRKRVSKLSDAQAREIRYAWWFHARPNQWWPDWDWRVWLLLAGRGFGKTRTGAEWVHDQAMNQGKRRIALVARSAADIREVMIEGQSGLLNVGEPSSRPVYQPSRRRLTWPNGAIATTYSADEPEALRGPNHDAAWADELATWRYNDAWTQLMLGLRIGDNPQCVVTTTPRPKKLIRDLRKAKTTALTTGTTYENRQNLAEAWFTEIITQYEGTTLGRQELMAELIEDMPGALWRRKEMIDKYRVNVCPDLAVGVVAVDPAVTAKSESNETGIIWGGMTDNSHIYVTGDHSGVVSSNVWAKRAITAYQENSLDRIVYEANQGGDLVKDVLMAAAKGVKPEVVIRDVWASRGKRTRAEPIAALYERGLVHHVGGLPELEDQLCNWVPGEGDSPDRLDALVWMATSLVKGESGGVVSPQSSDGPSKHRV